MAKYLVLIYGEEQEWAGMSAQEQQRLVAGHRELAAAAGPALLATHEVEPPSAATTLRADRSGRLSASDGPFLATKAAVGGYYLIEARDLDQVIGLVGRLYEATASHSGVEIRRVPERS